MDRSRPIPALPTLHVADIELPRELEPLYELAYNLWWSWSPEARSLFASIDTATWARYRNPVQLLINVEPRHWYSLLEDESFRGRYRQVMARFEAYLHPTEPTWFEREHPDVRGPIAYFSMEYGLHQSLSIYSGGLGILSGDHCKSASDLGVPLVAVGLLYQRGYFQQTIDADGLQQHIYPEYDFSRLPHRPLASPTGHPVLIDVPLPGRDVRVKLWLAQVGRVPLVLLDTDIPENDPADRPIASLLYVQGREMRLVQELILGMGGVKAIEALGIEPAVWHINEGHSAFLQLERLRKTISAGGDDLDGALQRIQRDAVFTTHTPVPAGNEQFAPELIDKYLSPWCAEVGMPTESLQALGRAHDDDTSFNLTALAIKTTSFVNGVSELNAEITSRMWRHLFPERAEQPILGITNGVHTGTWIGHEIGDLLERHLGERWREHLLSARGWEPVRAIPDREIWQAHGAQKARLGRFTRTRLRDQHARHGSSPDDLRAVGGMFDDQALTIGFARRFATYKRASLIFSDLERLHRLVGDDERPVQLLFAGKAHPADRPGQELIQRIFQLSRSRGLLGKIFFLENYDIRMGRMLVQGVDVWLNTPRRPFEASGTSGMKVALNGGLNFSILDGWWPEAFDGDNGWAIGDDHHTYEDEEAQDQKDATSLYETLENVILPLYYDRDADGLPTEWIARMKDAIATLTWKFSADRMLRDYVTEAYVPAHERHG